MDGDVLDLALRQVQRLFDREQTDGQLLDSFRTKHARGAFSALPAGTGRCASWARATGRSRRGVG